MKQTEQKPSLGWLLRKCKRQLATVGVLGVLNMAQAASQLWLALLSKDLIDAANKLVFSAQRPSIVECLKRPEFSTPAMWIVILILVQVVFSVLISNLRIRAEGRIIMTLKRSVFESLMSADYVRVQGYHSGELINRLTSDVALVSRNATTLVPAVLSMATRLIGGLIVLASFSPWFAAGVLVIGAVVMIVTRFFGAHLKRLHKVCQETDGKTRSFMHEVLGNL